MRIKYLGTAAYEGIPSMLCSCRVCRKARELGGRELRSRSQALINDELLMDFGPDTVWHSQRFGLDWSKIGCCLITHSHSDHLYPEDAVMTEELYSHEHRPLRFYAAEDGYRRLAAVISPRTPQAATVEQIEAGRRILVGDRAQYRVLPLRANHDPTTSPVIYSITCGEKRLLYAHDTGVFYKDTWEGMKSEGRYDLVSLDCTGSMNNRDRDHHMCLKTNREMLEEMRREGLADERTRVVISHFSHNGGATHEELCREAKKDGILVAYDGLEVEF